jgi:O-antigen ligase
VVSVLVVLALGWASALLPRSTYDPAARSFAPAGGWSHGAVDGTTAVLAMTQVSAVLAAMVVTCDLARRRWFRAGLLWTVAGTGVAVALLGIGQKLGLTHLALGSMDRHEGVPFATFNYQGNAGSFLNLGLPAVAAVAALALRRRGGARARIAAWLAVGGVAAATVTTGSKAAQAIAMCLVVAVPVVMPGLLSPRAAGRWTAGLMAAVIVAAVLGGVVATSKERWRGVGEEAGESGYRAQVWKATWRTFGHDPWFGDGPGGYKVVLPTSPYLESRLRQISIVSNHVPGQRVSLWSNVHEDYLQTLVEWGVVGSLAWAGVVGGGLLALWRAARGSPAGSRDRLLLAGAGLALAGLFAHALVDFPLQVPSLQLYAAVLLGLGWGCGTVSRPVDEPEATRAADRPTARDPGRHVGEGV